MAARSTLMWALLGIVAGLIPVSAVAQDGVRTAAQQPRVTIEPRPRPGAAEPGTRGANIRVETELVLIPVTVTDPLN
ncbi:MAG: hypothetical protein ACP5U2_11735, partial [Bryobacteraceae bacterium]